MRISLIAALLGSVESGLASMMVCNANNCLRAVQASAYPTRHGSADCQSYFVTTVTPATTTITATATSYSSTSAIDDVAATSTVDVTITDTIDVTTSFTDYLTSDVTSTAPGSTSTIYPAIPKRDNIILVRTVTIVPTSIPAYASPCSGSVAYSSACSCLGATPSTVTAATPSTTTTITLTSVTVVTTETETTTTADVTSTATTDSYTTIDAYATVITTSTTVVTPPEATFYAECASGNLIGSFNGFGIVQVVGSTSISITSADSGYSCCVACLLRAGCGAAGYASSVGQCYLLGDGGTCSASNQIGVFNTASTEAANGGIIVANTNCGKLVFGQQIG